MADSKLADLTELGTHATDDLLYIVSDPGGTPADRKITVGNMLRFKAPLHPPSVAVTDNYTLALTDDGAVLEVNKATAATITVPPNSSVAFAVGTIVEVYQQGAGQVTVAPGSGVTLRAPNGAKTAKQYATVSLRKRATDEWVLSGDTTT